MEIKCKTKDTLEFYQLTEFQGNFKARDDKDYAKIVKSIRKHGFTFPFFVWQHSGINHVLDGHKADLIVTGCIPFRKQKVSELTPNS